MTDAIILHHYDTSPFSEKVRLALALKGLGWRSCEIPVIMPKPDLTALTGGYRRTPVMQTGADIWCDTQLILSEIDARHPATPLYADAFAHMIAWTDRMWFQASVAVIFGALGDAVPEAFRKDREALSGRPFNTGAMKAAAPFMQDQWAGHLRFVEQRLAHSPSGWLSGDAPGAADLHAHMNPWFLRRNLPDLCKAMMREAPLTADWMDRLEAEAARRRVAPEPITGAEAVALAHAATPSVAAETDAPTGAVAPDDYGQDWVVGRLVGETAARIGVARTDARAGAVCVWFPKVGFLVRRDQAEG